MEEMLNNGTIDIETLERAGGIHGGLSFDEIKERLCSSFDLTPEKINDYDIISPFECGNIGMCPYSKYYIDSVTNDKIVITYSGDNFGFDKIGSVEYTFSRNTDGSIKLLSSKTLKDTSKNPF